MSEGPFEHHQGDGDHAASAAMKRLRFERRIEQEPTRPVSIRRIMGSRTFTLGVTDARAGRPFRPDYERWGVDAQWNYERGRAWALLTPRRVKLRRGGKLSPHAEQWFRRLSDIIL
jgi:hypothetical protein